MKSTEILIQAAEISKNSESLKILGENEKK